MKKKEKLCERWEKPSDWNLPPEVMSRTATRELVCSTRQHIKMHKQQKSLEVRSREAKTLYKQIPQNQDHRV